MSGPRSDLYQVIAFSEASGTSTAAIVQFRGQNVAPASHVMVGTKTIREVNWVADEEIEPAEAATAMVMDVAAWLGVPLGLAA